MSLDELLALVLLLLFAGDTTTNLIANGLLALSSHPDQLRRLGLAPEVLAPNAVQEVLRYDSPVQMIMRFCRRDTHIFETAFPGGAVVLALIGAANRDPAQFHAPDTFDIARHPNNHVAFGYGIHACIGAHLARLQGRIALGIRYRRHTLEAGALLGLPYWKRHPDYGRELMSFWFARCSSAWRYL